VIKGAADSERVFTDLTKPGEGLMDSDAGEPTGEGFSNPKKNRLT